MKEKISFFSEAYKALNLSNKTQEIITNTVSGIGGVMGTHVFWVYKTRKQMGLPVTWNLRLLQGIWPNAAFMVPLTVMRITFSTRCGYLFFGSEEKLSGYQRVVASLVGGSIPSLFNSPIEFMRAYQLKDNQTFKVTCQNFIKKYGIAKVIVGSPSTAMRDAIYTTGFYSLAPIMRQKLVPHTEYEVLTYVFSGFGAGIVSGIISHPFDTIKMLQQNKVGEISFSMIEACYFIFNRDGVAGFFNGLGSRLPRVALGVAIISIIREKMTQALALDDDAPERQARLSLMKS